MSDEQNATEGQAEENQKSSYLQSEETLSNNENSDSQDAGENEHVEADERQVESDQKESYSKEDLTKMITRAKAVAERRAKREAEAQYKAELDKLKEQQTQTQTYSPYSQQPGPGEVYDNVLGVIPANLTREEYSQRVEQALMALQTGTQNVQPQQTRQQPVQTNADEWAKETVEQLENCLIEMDDAEQILATSSINSNMANAACSVSQNGLKELIDLQKDNPSEIYRISRLSAQRQQFEIWNYLKSKATQKPKIASDANPQPKPIKEGSGIVNKSRDQMSYAEKKRLARKQIWGE